MAAPASPRRRALVVVYIPSHFTELLRFVRLLEASGCWDLAVYFARPYRGWAAQAALCRAEGVDAWDHEGRLTGSDEPPAGPVAEPADTRPAWMRIAAGAVEAVSPALRRRANRLALRLAEDVFAVASWGARRELARQVARAEALIAATRPDLLVLPEDSVEYGTAALIRAGHARGVRSLVVPFTVATEREAAEAYRDAPAHQLRSRAARRLAARHPHWVHVHEGQPLLRLPPARAFALERAGLAPPRPWTLNSGAADAIAVESPFMREHYLRLGLPAERLADVGSLADDALAAGLGVAEARKLALCREHGLDPARPLVLCALPPDQLAGGRAGCDFTSYRDLVDHWLAALAGQPWASVLVNLHPRMREADLAVPAGLGLSRSDLAAALPACDIFVASVSATIRWALASGKPTLNYDVYRYRYGDYEGAAGVRTFEDREELGRALGELADPEARRAASARARADAGRWGRLDGRVGERMLALCGRLAGEHEERA